MLKRAAAVTAVSNDLCKTLLQLGEGFPVRDKIHRIPMGVDVQRFSRLAAESERPDDLPRQGQVILFVGRLADKKGCHVLIDALSGGPPELSSAQLVVIGEGPRKADLIAFAAARGVAKRVHFLGARAHDRLPAYLAAADVFAQPSVHARDGDKDGLPVTLMEAAACGIPAVASDIGGIPEFLVDGENGRLVPPGDAAALGIALSRILGTRQVRDALGASARRRAQAFDWRLIADRYAAVLTTVWNRTGANRMPVATPRESGKIVVVPRHNSTVQARFDPD